MIPWLDTHGRALGPTATCEWTASHGRDVLVISSFEHRALIPYPDGLVTLLAYDRSTLDDLIEAAVRVESR